MLEEALYTCVSIFSCICQWTVCQTYVSMSVALYVLKSFLLELTNCIFHMLSDRVMSYGSVYISGSCVHIEHGPPHPTW